MNCAKIKVSVMMTTYNHEKYLEEAIRSVLAQRTDFKYELLIGEDCSTDHTRNIAVKYQRMYPDRIRLITHNRNVGALENEADLRIRCRGEYIAVLEGDDYWINCEKLKKQADFLDCHPEYIGTSHNVMALGEKGNKLPYRLEGFHYQQEHIYTREDALDLKMIGQLSGWMYRNIWKEISKKELEMIRKCDVNSDLKLSVALGLKGDIYYMEDVWSVYRRCFVGDGWSAKHYNKNVELFYYETDVKLKNLIKQCFGENVNIQDKLLTYIGRGVRLCREKPSRENIRILCRLLCKRDIPKVTILKYIWKKEKK